MSAELIESQKVYQLQGEKLWLVGLALFLQHDDDPHVDRYMRQEFVSCNSLSFSHHSQIWEFIQGHTQAYGRDVSSRTFCYRTPCSYPISCILKHWKYPISGGSLLPTSWSQLYQRLFTQDKENICEQCYIQLWKKLVRFTSRSILSLDVYMFVSWGIRSALVNTLLHFRIYIKAILEFVCAAMHWEGNVYY